MFFSYEINPRPLSLSKRRVSLVPFVFFSFSLMRNQSRPHLRRVDSFPTCWKIKRSDFVIHPPVESVETEEVFCLSIPSLRQAQGAEQHETQ